MKPDSGSFRDPDGYVTCDADGTVYRVMNSSYAPHYELAQSSKLFATLQKKNLLINFEECEQAAVPATAYKLIKPEKIQTITYPYEWCFSQLRDAALLTLDIQQTAIQHGLSLKDASAFNIQFRDAKPVFIDIFSFEIYDETKPFVAYKQFCQHFLAPLLLMRYVDLSLNKLFITHIDGVPLDIAAKLLPWHVFLQLNNFLHVYMHAHLKNIYSDTSTAESAQIAQFDKHRMLALLDSLRSTVRAIRFPAKTRTEWGNYYSDTNYTDQSMQHKEQLIDQLLSEIKPSITWDIGANNGHFSRVAARHSAHVIAADIDPVAVECNYTQQHTPNVLPLCIDFTNSSPAIGFANAERSRLIDRSKPDLIIALAFVHHMCIANNIPLSNLAACLAGLAPQLILEFVPKEDSQVQRLLRSRADIFTDYTYDGCIAVFSQFYELAGSYPIDGTCRVLLHLRRR